MELKKGIKKAELGEIPNDWLDTEFGEVLTGFSSGQTPYRGIPKFYRGDIPWITSGELNYNEITDTVEKITEEAVRKTNLKIIPKGTFLFAITGLEAAGTRGSCAITGIDATTNQSCMALYPKDGKITTSFLYHFYRKYGNWLAFRYCQGTKQQSFTGGIAKKLPIVLPPTTKEQTAIATALSDADALIASLEKLIAKKRLIKQGVIQKLLEPKEGWVEMKLEDVTERIIGGGTPSRSNPNYWNGNIPWVTVKDFATFDRLTSQEYISKQGLKNSASNLISKGTIITTTRMALGKAVIYDVDVAINQDLKAIQLKSNHDTLFFYYWFQFNENRIKEMGSGSTVMGISLTDLRQLEMHLPSLNEQKNISRTIRDIDNEIAGLEFRLGKIKYIKQGMMQTLLTGKIRLI